MQYIYFGIIFAATVIFLLIGLLLFMQRKRGERSRMILAGMSLMSMLNYIGMIIYFYIGPAWNSASIMDVPFLLLGIFVTMLYFIYPIEVVSPGWITWKRLLKIYLPVIGLYLLYRVTLAFGVEYTSYKTIAEMAQDIRSFQLIFRVVLAILIFLPALLLYYVPYTRKYNNADYKWMGGYIAVVTINTIAYLCVNVINTFMTSSIYVVISVMCSMYIAYQELYVRLIGRPIYLQLNEPEPIAEIDPKPVLNTPHISTSKESDLFERLEQYMNNTQAWQDPDLSVEKLISTLYTNRTSLLKAIQQHGYSGYTSYVNGKRVAEFIQIINLNGEFNYKQTFFDVGFRSKTTALRNFKDITGMIPSEYFQRQTESE